MRGVVCVQVYLVLVSSAGGVLVRYSSDNACACLKDAVLEILKS